MSGGSQGHELGRWVADWVIRWRFAVVAGCLALAIGAGFGSRQLSFTNQARAWFGEGNPELEALDAMEHVYSKSDNILFVVEAKGGDVFTPEVLGAVAELVDRAWQLPYSARVDGLTNFQHVRADGDDMAVGELVPDPTDLTTSELEALRGFALSEHALVNRLISEDASVTGVNVVLRLPGASLDEVPESVAAARELASDLMAEIPGIGVRITGTATLNDAFSESAKRDFRTLIPAMYLVILVMTGLLLRSITGTVATFGVISLSTITALGLAGWMGLGLNPASISAPTIILTLAVADSVHILVHLFEGMRAGLTKEAALKESLHVNLKPVFLTSLTTAIGFLSLNFSDAPPFRTLGNVTALGVAAAFLFATLLLPALVAILPVRRPKATARPASCLEGIGRWVIRRKAPLLWGTILVTAISGLLVTRNELDDRFVEYFDEGISFRTDTQFTVDRLTGIYRIDYSVGAVGEGGVADPEYLRALDRFVAWFEARNDVVHVAALPETMKRLNRSMHGDEEEFYMLPETRELASQYLLLYELSLPYGLDLNDQISLDRGASRVVVTLDDVSAVRMRELAREGEAWLETQAPAYMASTAAGNSLMFANISKRNIEGMLGGTLLAFLFVSTTLVLALKSWRMGLVSLLPNVVPSVMAFGLWGLVDGRINMGMVIVVAISMGIVVDDTVHFLSKFQQGRVEKGLEGADAIRYAFATVGRAIVFTSVILVLGFGILSFSTFQVNSSMGLLTACTILLALAADFLLLPPVLLWITEKSGRKDATMNAHRKAATSREPATRFGALMLFLALALPGNIQAQAVPSENGGAQERGLAIAVEADRREGGFGDFSASLTMILRNRHGDESTRELRIQGLEMEEDGDRTLLAFDSPAAVKGTALLSWGHKTDPDDQWLFLPALRRVKRIASDNKSGPFMGSEFAYEDISSQEVEKYTYRFLGEEDLDDEAILVVERVPSDPKSGYTRQVVWYDKEYRVRKIDFYDRKDALLKSLTFQEYRFYDERFWRAQRMEMVNHQNGKSTDLLWAEFIFDTGLSERDFDQANLRRRG